MARLGANVREISDEESAMVHSIIELEDKQVRDILTPWPVLFTLGANSTVAEALQALREQRFSRIPIYENDKDDIVGYVTVHDLAGAAQISRSQNQLKTLAKPMTFIPDTENCLHVLTTFLKQRRQIAMVVNEQGRLVGLVTLEDLIETALGTEIVDETDQVADLREKARLQTAHPRLG